eukprot:TRINITY_DN25006_c0_g1_i1.p1 TRINITY_DN25006_c0_g1~~TRINITY_DN25006_c0_g1_i1.p1  ORF type:complete len:629 (+),score=224.25 TRINITY_DN25006_c0_g1_i1:66-1889(+)
MSVEGVASGHALHGYRGRSVKCPCCQKIGPSPQTGPQECQWCRVCASCAEQQQSKGVGYCAVTGLAEDLEECGGDVAWHYGDSLLMVRDAGQPGAFYYAAEAQGADEKGRSHSDKQVDYQAGYTMSYSSGQTLQRPPSVVVGDQRSKPVVTLPLPEHLDDRQAVLAALTLLLNRLSVAHSLPGGVDHMDQPLPQVLDMALKPAAPVPRGPWGTVLTGNGGYLLTRHARALRLHQMVPKGAKEVWRRDIGTPAPTADGAPSLHCLDLAPNGKRVAVVGQQAQLLNALNGHELALLASSDEPYTACHAVAFSACSRYVAVVGDAFQVAVFKTGDGENVSTIPSSKLAEYKAGRWCVAFSSSGGALVMSAEKDGKEYGAVMAFGWRTVTDSEVVVSPVLHSAHTARAVVTQFSADDTALLVGSADGALLVHRFNADGEAVLHRKMMHPVCAACPEVTLVAAGFSSCVADEIVSGTSEGTVWYWTADGLHAVQRVEENLDHQRTFASMDFTTSGMLAMTDTKGSVRLNAMPIQCTPFAPLYCRVHHQHAGQIALLHFLMWQVRLNKQAADLPAGSAVLRQLPVENLKCVVAFMPNVHFGDIEEKSGGCAVM